MNAEDTFRIMSVGSTIGAERSNNVEKFRDRSSKARDQTKSANEQLGEKPGLVIFHQDSITSSEEIFISAFYGDMTYEFSVDGGEGGSLFFRRNGIWNKEQNRTLSAAIYIRKDERPIIVYNLWAKTPLPQGLFECKEYIPEDNGSFTVRE